MNLENESRQAPKLARALVGEQTTALAVVVRCTYAIDHPDRAPIARTIVGPAPLLGPLSWGASVTVDGTVGPVRKGDRFRRLRLAFAGRTSSAVAFGPRTWARRGDGLVPSAPGELAPIPLSASLAFGGSFDLPPGEIGGLPHPRLVASFPLNAMGVGFYQAREQAAGQPLPSFEHEDMLVRDWRDRPEPALFAPCPHNLAVRMPTPDEIVRDPIFGTLLVQHPAPRRHIVESLAAGGEIEVDGIGDSRIRAAVPASPVTVTVRRRGRWHEIRGTIRNAHVDADARTLTCVFGHSFSCPSDAPARDIVCTDRRDA